MRYVIEPVANSTSHWAVTTPTTPFSEGPTVHVGTAVDCIAWCEQQGAVRRGPRVFEKEDTTAWFGAWRCGGTFIGDAAVEVPRRCPTHDMELLAEPSVIVGGLPEGSWGTVHEQAPCPSCRRGAPDHASSCPARPARGQLVIG